MRRIRFAVEVKGGEDPFSLKGTLKNHLPVGEQELAVAAELQRPFPAADGGQPGDEGRSVPFLPAARRRGAGHRPRPLGARRAPFAAVIEAGDAGDGEQQGIGQREKGRIPQAGSNAVNVVVIEKLKGMGCRGTAGRNALRGCG